MKKQEVKAGVDVLLENHKTLLQGNAVGLITNHTGVSKSLDRSVDALLGAGADVRALFGPEHGLAGTAQDGDEVGHATDARSGLQVYSLYGERVTPSAAMLDGLDVLVFDMQDVGARFYTYLYTMANAMKAAARYGLAFVVLDRPNPITGATTEGAPVEEAFASFVGDYGLPFRHGLTVGEVARYINGVQGWGAALEVVPIQGWSRALWFDETDLPWVTPSPNMPTLDTAVVYPGTVLFEGTNLSEGRGTTRPFELLGAPWLNAARVVASLRLAFDEAGARGVGVREASFSPLSSKHANTLCHGFQLHVMDREIYEPVKCAVICLKTVRDERPQAFSWRRHQDGTFAVDRLAGTDALRTTVDAGAPLAELLERMTPDLSAFEEVSQRYYLYDKYDKGQKTDPLRQNGSAAGKA